MEKLREFLIRSGRPDLDIEVDGGVTTENVRSLMEAGANVFVAGSAVFKNDISGNVKAFMDIFKEQES